MKKKKDVITIIICLIILAICVGVFIYRGQKKKEADQNRYKEPEIITYETKEEVLEEIKKTDKSVKFVSEFEDCRSFISDTKEYVYCKGDQEIAVNNQAMVVPKENTNKGE